MSDRLLIVIPTLNERENLGRLLPRLLVLDVHPDILVVDDASSDGTPALVKGHAAFGTRIHILERPCKMGLGTAYVAGFKWALGRDYQFIMEMDADLSHDPAEVPRFVETAAQGADLVIGSRYVDGVRVLNWPIGRLLLSLGAAQYVRLITGLPLTDPTGGFKCFRRRVLETVNLDSIASNGYSFQIEMNYLAWLAGFHIREIPIVFEDRHDGTSKMSPQIAREALWMVWKIAGDHWFRRPSE